MALSRNELLNIICICCGRKYGDHYKGHGNRFNLPELLTCMLRLQGTIVADGISNSPEP